MKIDQSVQEIWSGHESVTDGLTKGIPITPLPLCGGGLKKLLNHGADLLRRIANIWIYSKTCLKCPLSKRPKIGFQVQLSLNAGPLGPFFNMFDLHKLPICH